MKKKNGFIAISLIYSFFLVFLITLLAIVSDYAHNRILLSNAKNAIKEKLNGLSEFNPLFLPKVDSDNNAIDYNKVNQISYLNEEWKILNVENQEVTLMLNRDLNKEEIENALSDVDGAINEENPEQIHMCLTEDENNTFCNSSILYIWQISLARKVVDIWFEQNALLQKAKSNGALAEMNFLESGNEYSAYIRIPKYAEITDSNIAEEYWNYDNPSETTTSFKTIRPVITVEIQ